MPGKPEEIRRGWIEAINRQPIGGECAQTGPLVLHRRNRPIGYRFKPVDRGRHVEFFGRGGALKPSWYGDCLPSRDFPMLIDLHLQGRLPLEKFVSETIGLDGVEEAFHKMERGEVLRSVVLL